MFTAPISGYAARDNPLSLEVKLMSHWPIFVISLADAGARRASLLRSLDALGLEWELFEAVDGRRGLGPVWESLIDREGAAQAMGRPLTNGEFGCALSHRGICEIILQRGLAGVIVLEDDAIIGPDFERFVREELYHTAPLVMLDHSHARVSRFKRTTLPVGELRYLTLPSCLTTGYSVNASAAAELLKAATPVRMAADWPGDIVALGAAVITPQIVNHPPADTATSHLEGERNKFRPEGSSLQRFVKRWSNLSYWQRWLTKRLSIRVS